MHTAGAVVDVGEGLAEAVVGPRALGLQLPVDGFVAPANLMKRFCSTGTLPATASSASALAIAGEWEPITAAHRPKADCVMSHLAERLCVSNMAVDIALGEERVRPTVRELALVVLVALVGLLLAGVAVLSPWHAAEAAVIVDLQPPRLP